MFEDKQLDQELMNKILLESRQIAQLNDRLADQLQSSKDTAKRLKDDVSKLQEQYTAQASDSRLKFLEQQIVEKDLAVQRTQKKLDESSEELSRREAEIKSMQEHFDEIQKKISTKNEMIGELGRNLQTKDNEWTIHEEKRQHMAGQVGNLSKELGHREEQIQVFHEAVDKLELNLQDTQKSLEQNNKEKEVMAQVIERAKSDNDSKAVEIRNLRKNLNILADDLTIKDRLLHETKRSHLEKQKGLRKLNEDFRVLQEQLKVLDQANTEVLKRQHRSDAVVKDLEAELAHQKEINRKLEQHWKAILTISERKHATRMRALIADSTQSQLRLQMQLDELKHMTKEEPMTPEPRPLHPEPEEEIDLGFMSATPEELVPMVRTALDHGDSTDKIHHSLVNSGYDTSVVEKAIEKVKKASV